MAKKETKEEDEYTFVPPEFDEDAFIHKEMVSFRTTIGLVVMGIVAAGISWGMYGIVGPGKTGWLVGLLVMATSFALLRPIFIRFPQFDIEHWGRREWLGTAFLLFFTWLAFFIFLINPPISDYAEPTVNVYVSPGAQEAGNTLVFDLFASDNAKLKGVEFDLLGPVAASTNDLTDLGHGHYRLILEDAPQGEYAWNFSARDGKGLTSYDAGTTVVNDVLQVTLTDMTVPTGTVFVRAPEELDVWAVYLQMTNGTDRVFLGYDEELQGWKAHPNYLGFTEGTNEFHVILEEKNHFQGQTLIQGGKITEGPYSADVAGTGEFDKSIPRAQNVDAPIRNVPGFELVGLVGALVIVGLVARRR